MSLDQLINCEPLSQVVFVHDYIQLIFQDCRINVYNTAQIIDSENISVKQGEVGFADKLVELIDHRVAGVSSSDRSVLVLSFTNGIKFEILKDMEFCHGPEAFEACGSPLTDWVVQKNA